VSIIRSFHCSIAHVFSGVFLQSCPVVWLASSMKDNVLLAMSPRIILVIMMPSIIHNLVLRFFETSESFCTWLKSSLKSHPTCCSKCRWSNSHGCVSYDVCITICHQQKSLTMVTPSEFADASYHHCVDFRKLSSREALC